MLLRSSRATTSKYQHLPYDSPVARLINANLIASKAIGNGTPAHITLARLTFDQRCNHLILPLRTQTRNAGHPLRLLQLVGPQFSLRYSSALLPLRCTFGVRTIRALFNAMRNGAGRSRRRPSSRCRKLIDYAGGFRGVYLTCFGVEGICFAGMT